MSILKEILSDQYLAEMSNIDPEEHNANINLTFHILQPGTWNHSGPGPRIKLFKGNFKTSNNIVIMIDKDPNNIKVLEKSYDKKLLKQSQLNDIIIYFKKYRFAYLIMWLDPGMSNLKLTRMLDVVDKDPKSIESKFYEIYNTL